MTALTVPDQAGLARLNRSLVLAALRTTGPTSRTELVRRTPFTKATISVIVEELVRDGLVRQLGAVAPSGRGRPVQLLEYIAAAHVVAGVHLGVRTTHVVLADGTGRAIVESRTRTPAGPAEEVLSAVAADVGRLCAEVGVDGVHVVGLCLPGRVDTETGWCHRAPNLGWADVPVGELLGRLLDAPVHVVNDAQAALIAEHASGAGEGIDDLVVLYAGDGVSAAVLSKGRLFSGATGASGEIGHCPVAGATERCGCGRRGCLETEASTRSVLARVRRALRAGQPSSLRKGSRLTAGQVLDQARAGDPVAVEAVQAAGTRLGEAAGVLINVFNPSLVVVAGELSRAGTSVVEAVRAAAQHIALPDSWAATQVVLARHADDAEVLGAVAVAVGHLDLLRPSPRRVTQ